MKLAVVGSRDYFPLQDVADYVNSLPLDITIVSGGAPGVDKMAEKTATQRGMQVEILKADWANLGPGAGMIRNLKLVDVSDKVVAFWDLQSPGTAHTILAADKKGKLLSVKISLQKAVSLARKIRGA